MRSVKVTGRCQHHEKRRHACRSCLSRLAGILTPMALRTGLEKSPRGQGRAGAAPRGRDAWAGPRCRALGQAAGGAGWRQPPGGMRAGIRADGGTTGAGRSRSQVHRARPAVPGAVTMRAPRARLTSGGHGGGCEVAMPGLVRGGAGRRWPACVARYPRTGVRARRVASAVCTAWGHPPVGAARLRPHHRRSAGVRSACLLNGGRPGSAWDTLTARDGGPGTVVVGKGRSSPVAAFGQRLGSGLRAAASLRRWARPFAGRSAFLDGGSPRRSSGTASIGPGGGRGSWCSAPVARHAAGAPGAVQSSRP